MSTIYRKKKICLDFDKIYILVQLKIYKRFIGEQYKI